MLKKTLFLLTLAFSTPCLAEAPAPYLTNGDCDGFPKLNLETPNGLCVGLVASQLGFARGVSVIGTDIYLLDMGGWRKGHGRLLRMGDNGKKPPEVLLEKLDQPNSIINAPGKSLYIGLLGKVIKYDPATRTHTDIVINLPADGQHPLPALAAAADGSLFINIGSATDHCEKDDAPPDPKTPCHETQGVLPRGTIIRVTPQATPVDARTIKPYASGLRNSMALAVSAGQLYAGVNSRDAIDIADAKLSDAELPHDTFVKVVKGGVYGWPYCYDNNIPNPEYAQYNCVKTLPPTYLLPPHSAPLGMLFYKGNSLSSLKNKLLIGYHGYQPLGHRVVAFSMDRYGKISSPVEIIKGWDARLGDHPQGAPVGLAQLKDGSVLITEDHNGTLLRLARGK